MNQLAQTPMFCLDCRACWVLLGEFDQPAEGYKYCEKCGGGNVVSIMDVVAKVYGLQDKEIKLLKEKK